MINTYFILKFIHILTATFIFGTGIGTAFFMLLAYLSGDLNTFKNTTRHVIIADWIFTAPSVIIQPLTGIWLMQILHYPLNSIWFAIVMGLYILAGICWIIVVFIQYHLHALTKQTTIDVKRMQYYMRRWVGLGIPAFVAIIIIYWLMVSKWGIALPMSKFSLL